MPPVPVREEEMELNLEDGLQLDGTCRRDQWRPQVGSKKRKCYDRSTSKHGDATCDCACNRQLVVGIYDFVGIRKIILIRGIARICMYITELDK